MNSLPDRIITPFSAYRIPQSLGGQVLEQLVAAGINASAFFMDDNLLDEFVAKGFANDIERAKSELLAQLPGEIRSTISFPLNQVDGGACKTEAKGKRMHGSNPVTAGMSSKLLPYVEDIRQMRKAHKSWRAMSDEFAKKGVHVSHVSIMKFTKRLTARVKKQREEDAILEYAAISLGQIKAPATESKSALPTVPNTES